VDKRVLEAFAKAELVTPSARKFIDGAPIHVSRHFDRPRKYGDVVLSDFGSAVRGNVKRDHDAQPNVYRSPEVMLKVEWSYPVDIWNVGVMVCSYSAFLPCRIIMLIAPSFRYGICLKGDTCSMAKTRTAKDTPPVPISQR
jgi:hypothetical protein